MWFRRCAVLVSALTALCCMQPAQAGDGGSDPLSNDTVPFAQPDFATAEKSFAKLAATDRATLQIVMTALGCWKGSVTQSFTQPLFAAVQECQQNIGIKADGNPDENTYRTLISRSKPLFRSWGFRIVYLTPAKTDFTWVPFGVDGSLLLQNDGAIYLGADEKVFEHLFHFANTTARAGFQNFLSVFMAEQKAGKTQAKIESAIQRLDGFIIRVSRVRDNGKKEALYLRAQQLGSELVGFIFSWNPDDAEVEGERAALLISDAFAASHYHLAFIPPPSQHDLIDERE